MNLNQGESRELKHLYTKLNALYKEKAKIEVLKKPTARQKELLEELAKETGGKKSFLKELFS